MRTLLKTLLLAAAMSAALPAAPLPISSGEESAREAIGGQVSGGRLLWCRDDKIYHSRLNPWSPQQVTGSAEEGRPRWAPDGTGIVFHRRSGDTYDVWLMNEDFAGARMIIPGAHTADWAEDGTSVTAIEHNTSSNRLEGYRVLRYSLADDAVSVLHDVRESGFNGWQVSQAAELHPEGRFLLTFTLDDGGGRHRTYIADMVGKDIIYNDQMWRGDCSPGWSPDGAYLTNTARTSTRPVLKAGFDYENGTVTSSDHFAGMPGSDGYYIHGHRVSNDGRWLVAGVLWRSGDLQGNREIYLWRIDDPDRDDHAVRLTFDSEEDHSPCLYAGTGDTQPRIALSPAELEFSASVGGPDPDPAVTTVTNAGGGTLHAAVVSEDAEWLGVSGGAEGNRQELTNTVTVAGLAAGTYQETVFVSIDNAPGSPAAYTVRLEIVAMRKADVVDEAVAGLHVTYYPLVSPTELPEFNTVVMDRRDSVAIVDYPLTSGDIAGSGRSDNVGAVFEGYVSVPEDGAYTFSLESDDGAALYVGDMLVVDNDGSHDMRESSGTIGLEAGLHRLRLEYFEATGGAGLILRYESASIPKRVVPADALFREPLQLPHFTIVRPAEGEVWPAGSVRSVEWTGENAQEAVVELSIDDGKTWMEDIWRIEYGTQHWGNYPLTVPEVPSDKCRIRIATYNGEGSAVSERFQIAATAAAEPARGSAVRSGAGPAIRISRGMVLVRGEQETRQARVRLLTPRGRMVAGHRNRTAHGCGWSFAVPGRGAYVLSIRRGHTESITRIVVP